MLSPDRPFLLITLLALLTVVLVAAMKYFAATRQAQIRQQNDREFRAALAGVQTDNREIKMRLASIEKILREVE